MLGRRNLTPDQFRLLLGRRYNRLKQNHGGQVSGSSGKNYRSPKTSDQLAQEHGVSEKTVRNAGAAAELIDTKATAELKDCAVKMFHMRISPEEIRKALSVSKRTVSNWLESPLKDQREKTNQAIMDMYLACYSQEEIAAAVDSDKATVNRKIDSLLQNGNLAKTQQTLANHEEQDFQIPLYNVWTKSKISTELKHFPSRPELTYTTYTTYTF